MIVNASLLDTAPEVVKFLCNHETTTGMHNEVLDYMRETEAEADEAAMSFLNRKESAWTE